MRQDKGRSTVSTIMSESLTVQLWRTTKIKKNIKKTEREKRSEDKDGADFARGESYFPFD